ncbi:hypothetical protein BGY98DRAFT_1101658 [Russula aff. rugulosa BPL654]|nr:hypothetical protein BGY98DRAFT_1101658 [Russula aff. rugulosa BPL654]
MQAAVKPSYLALSSQTLWTGNLPRSWTKVCDILSPSIYDSRMHFLTEHAITGEYLSRFRVQSGDIGEPPRSGSFRAFLPTSYQHPNFFHGLDSESTHQSSSNIDTTPKSLNTQLVPAREKVERLLLSDVEEEELGKEEGEKCVHVSKGEVGTSKKSMMSSVSPTPISVHRTNINLID